MLRQPKVKVDVFRCRVLHRSPKQVRAVGFHRPLYVLQPSPSDVGERQRDAILCAHLAHEEVHRIGALQAIELTGAHVGDRLPLEGIRIEVAVRVLEGVLGTAG